MFGKMMNNYYYGKSGKGDFKKDDLPHNRRELFSDTLKTRLSALCRINLLYMLIFLPAMILIMFHYTNFMSFTSNMMLIEQSENYIAYYETIKEAEQEVLLDADQYQDLKDNGVRYNNDYLDSTLLRLLIWLIPCLAITGPFTAGLSYITRNWARDEHAFIWSDFKDAVKENWKQALVISLINSVIPAVVYIGWKFYGQMAAQNAIMFVPQVLIVLIALIWAISITYMYPLAVTYQLKMKDLLRNGFLLGVARLPMSVAIRLLHCVPALICVALMWFWNPWYGMMILFAWYALIGFSLSRFITASYTNAVFDRFINPKIEGAKVNQGLHITEDEEEEPEASGEGESDD